MNYSIGNNYKYIIHLSDIHIRLYKRQEEYKEVFNRLYKSIDEIVERRGGKNNGIIVITGDIFHDKVTLSSESVILCTEFFINLSSRLKTIVIPGNHDGLLNSSERVDNISGVISHKTIDNLYYFKNSGIYKFDNFIFGVSSIFDNLFVNASEIELTNNEIKIGLYHGLVGSLKLQEMYEAKGEKSIEDFKGYDYVLLGDIHTFQYLDDNKRIAYASSLISQNFTETDTNHGFLFWDIENNSSKYISIPNDYHHKICYIDNNILTIKNNNNFNNNENNENNVNTNENNVNTNDSNVDTNDNNENNNIEIDLSLECDVEKLKYLLPSHGRIKLIIENSSINNEYINLLKNLPFLKKVYWSDVNNTLINKGKENDKNKRMTSVEVNIKDIIKEIIGNDDTKQKYIDFIYNDLMGRLNKRDDNIGSAWNLIELRINNLCLYGENNIIDLTKFSIGDIILIHGRNNIGKSSLIDIISYLLYNKMGRNINMGNKKSHEIININKREGSGELIFKLGDTKFHLKRTYKKNIRNDLKFDSFLYANDILLVKGNDVNKKIEELIGSYDDFIFMNIMLQFDNLSFRNMKQNDRKHLLNRLLDLNGYEKVETDIKPLFQTLDRESKNIFNEIKDVNIIDMKNNNNENMKSLNDMNENIDILEEKKNIIIEKNNNLNMEFVKIDTVNENELKKSRGNINEKIIKTNNLINQLSKELDENQLKINELSVSLFEEEEKYKNIRQNEYDEDVNKNSLKNELKIMENDLENLLQKKKQNNLNYDEKTIDNLLKAMNNKMSIIYENEKSLNKIENEYNLFMETFNKEIREHEDNIKLYQYELDKIIKNPEYNINDWNNQNCENELDNINNIIENSGNFINTYVDIIKDFEKNDIKRKMSDYKMLKIEHSVLLNDIRIYENLIKSLEGHEYNPNCAQCMKNPKVNELFKYSKILEDHLLNKDKIEFEIEESSDIEIVYEEYEKIKNELNENYKNYNEGIKKRDVIEIKHNYFELKEKINNENEKWNNNNNINLKIQYENNIKIYQDKIINKQIFEKEINELVECRNIIQFNNQLNKEIVEIKEKIIELKRKMNEEYDKFMEKKNLFTELSMKVMKNNVMILENKNIVLKEENLLENINNKLTIIEKNNEINKNINELKNEQKRIDGEINCTKNDIYKLNELIKNNERIIKNYEDKKSHFLKIYEEKELYGTYLELVNKNGLPLHILKRYLTHISDGINGIAEEFIHKKIDLFIEDNDIVLNIIVKDDVGSNRNIMMLGGRESFILDIAFKIVLAKIAQLPKSNFIFIDEGISVFDKEHIGSINELFAYLSNYFDYVFLMSHIEEIKDYVSRKIYIRSAEDGSSIIRYECQHNF